MASIEYFDSKTMQLSVVDFNTIASLRVPFSVRAVEETRDLVDHLEHVNSEGNKVFSGLQLAEEHFSSVSAKSKFVVLITNAESLESYEMDRVSKLKREFEVNGLSLVIVAVGDEFVSTQLTKLVVQKNLYMVDTSENIIGLVMKFREDICERAN